ncbi:MAG TPA: helix-turn-helix domain-containing protein [Cyclobacteriaceae bacterium]|nr:helix-turn-helix domain-containing protein [Cyclobacteriaceae bacterium]
MKDSREHILATSLQLFLQKSFKEVTMREIVEQTGLSKGAFYHYFSSKEQVFEEILHHFFADFFREDFNQLPNDGLLQFYSARLADMERKLKAAEMKFGSNNKQQVFNSNYYYLLFDAMKMLPSFKKELFAHQGEELKAWIRVVRTARKNKEIDTKMTDAQVAKLFIFAGDGMGINLILTDDITKMKRELQSLWDGIYLCIKT